MRLYETIFILRPDLSEEETKELIQRIVQVIEQNKGELIRMDEWGLSTLAYKIRKFSKAYYVYSVFMGDYQCVRELERHFKMLDPVLRHLIVKLDERELETHKQAQMAKERASKVEPTAGETPEGPVPASKSETEAQLEEEMPA